MSRPTSLETLPTARVVTVAALVANVCPAGAAVDGPAETPRQGPTATGGHLAAAVTAPQSPLRTQHPHLAGPTNRYRLDPSASRRVNGYAAGHEQDRLRERGLAKGKPVVKVLRA